MLWTNPNDGSVNMAKLAVNGTQNKRQPFVLYNRTNSFLAWPLDIAALPKSSRSKSAVEF